MQTISTTRIKRANNSSERRSSPIRNLLLLGGSLLFVFALIGFFLYRKYQLFISEPLSVSDASIQFSIEEGTSVDTILGDLVGAEILEEGDLLFMRMYLKLNELGGTIQAGEFIIPLDLDPQELVKTLQSGQMRSVWVTLPEGLRVDEYADILEDAFADGERPFNRSTFLSLIDDQIFIRSLALKVETDTLEGFLFPDKYLFPITITEEEIIRAMAENFNSRVGEATYADIVIASLLEREGRTEEERKMISDILKRRLNEGWFLNIDATLLYYHKDWTRELTVQDLEEDQPYNTYVKLGFPPTPICNPGEGSIKAAMAPTPNNYYYYIHDDNGNIHYAVTLEEQTANINKYLQ